MKEQTYATHRRYVPGFHFALFGLLLAGLGGATTNLVVSWSDHARVYAASLILLLVIAALMLFFYARLFALRAQDRAIRAEENLRHFILAGKLLDSRLGVYQIVALRFAPDNEFVELAKKAATESLPPEDIKKQIKHWRADFHRV